MYRPIAARAAGVGTVTDSKTGRIAPALPSRRIGCRGFGLKDPPPLIDIHCHLLPEVDDGASGWEETRAMAEIAVADGISTVVVTPHQLGNFGRNGGQMIRAKVVRLREFLDEWAIPLRVEAGADVRIEPDMIRRIQAGEVLTLADRRRHVLL